ncbi:hypothetical protein [Actinacidiphila sp. bgisy144]|uniref:hypothetical protein n=1 Tax=Actinacidiphila sp. bgisy144 TaxID=3413791 RepID=UPI003EBA350B
MVTRERGMIAAAVVLGLALVLATLYGGYVVLLRDRTTSPRRDLLLPSLPAPGQWQQSGRLPSEDGEATRTWGRSTDGFAEVVYGYHSNGAAARQFTRSSPQKTEPYLNGNARPDDIGVRVPQADQAQYMCGEYDHQVCDTWWAWLRFGKVDVELRYEHEVGASPALTDPELASVVTRAATTIAAMAEGT